MALLGQAALGDGVLVSGLRLAGLGLGDTSPTVAVLGESVGESVEEAVRSCSLRVPGKRSRAPSPRLQPRAQQETDDLDLAAGDRPI